MPTAYPIQLYKFLLNLRPAPLGSFIKRVLAVQRLTHKTALGTFFIDPCSNLGIALLSTNRYEETMEQVFRTLLQPGATCVDLGANEGYFTVIAAQLVGPHGCVLAIEPQARLAPVLAQNIALNQVAPQVTLAPVAVSDRVSEAILHLSVDNNTGSSGFTRMTKYGLPTQTVQTTTLAALLDQHKLAHVDLLKIDIEGHEYEAILGSPEVFKTHRVRHIALELHPSILSQRKLDANAITDFLQSAGYTLNPKFTNMLYSAPM